jgi:hypothetical protein
MNYLGPQLVQHFADVFLERRALPRCARRQSGFGSEALIDVGDAAGEGLAYIPMRANFPRFIEAEDIARGKRNEARIPDMRENEITIRNDALDFVG